MNQYRPPTGSNQPRPQPGPHDGQAPSPQQPGPHNGQGQPHQWRYSPASAKRPAPITALYRLGIVLVTLLLLSAAVDGTGWLLGVLAHGNALVWIGLVLGVVWVVLRLALLGVGIAGLIVGIIAFVRMTPSRARIGALLVTLAAGMCALGTSVSGSGGLPDVVRAVLVVIEVLATVVPLVLGILGLLWLRAGKKAGGGQGA